MLPTMADVVYPQRLGVEPIGEPSFHPSTTTAPMDTPTPSGSAPRKPRAPRSTAGKAKARKRAPRKAAPPRSAVGEMAADAAAQAVAKEPRQGRPSNLTTKNDATEAGLKNFYIGAGAMMKMAGAMMKQPRLSDVGAQMMAQAADCAAALVVWSNSSPAVKKALEAITVGGGAAVVLAAHAPIVLAALGMTAPEVAIPYPTGDPDADEKAMDLGGFGGFDVSTLAQMGAAMFGGNAPD